MNGAFNSRQICGSEMRSNLIPSRAPAKYETLKIPRAD